LSSEENVIPDWVWKRRYSSRFNRNVTIVLSLVLGIFGFVIAIAGIYAREDIYNACLSPTGCPTLTAPGTPLANAVDLLGLVITPLGAALAAGGWAYALSTWRARELEWAAVLGLQPLAKRLQIWYSQGKVTRQQVEEILADLRGPPRR
jgi:hypothetical protein